MLRVVRSLETYSVRRQLDGTVSQETSDWTWVTTLPRQQAPTERIVAWGHQRRDIENFGFNELVNAWEPITFISTSPRPSKHFYCWRS